MGDEERLRVAIVGLGPKGLFALERLLHHARVVGAAIDVDVFEPSEHPGAGPVYDPTQPAYLRMNLAADRLTMWPGESLAVAACDRLSFVQWRTRECGVVDGERFPPRAQVGRYLAWGLAAMLRAAPPGVRVTLRRSEVRAVVRRGARWRVVECAARALAAGPMTAASAVARVDRDYDEVLVATGHSRSHGWSPDDAVPVVPAVFPVTRWLSPDRVPAGATVAIRGFALTFIDAALALTEGRGGTFELGDHPYRLRYDPSAADAGLILPFSRSGRPMLAKPEPQLAAGVPALEEIAGAGRDEILALAPGFGVRDELLEILASTVAASLVAATRPAPAARAWLDAACDGHAPPAGMAAVAELERSLAVGAGMHPPDLQWALGHVWRSVYPALVTRLGGAAMSEREWPVFRRLAAQMERVAFGPPAINAAKLLALVEAGRVDLTCVAGGRVTSAAGQATLDSDDGARAIDLVIDAVLPGPGAAGSPLLAQLVGHGHARIARGQRGLDVAPDGSCFGRDGARAPGLSAIGRPTEDSVIGNDTLDRTLHPHADRWALRVTERASSAAPGFGTAEPRAVA